MTSQQNTTTRFFQGAVIASRIWSCGCYCYYFNNYYGHKDDKDYHIKNEDIVKDSNNDKKITGMEKSNSQFERQDCDMNRKKMLLTMNTMKNSYKQFVALSPTAQ